MLLSILIPTIKRHEQLLTELMLELARQIRPYEDEIEVLVDRVEEDTIGEKRNRLLEKASGEWLCFIDSDDSVAQNYIELLMKAIESDCDCASLKGRYSVDGREEGIFEHSLKYNEWKTNEGLEPIMGLANPERVRFERTPNHLNMLRSSIAKQFQFPEKNFSEDFEWSVKIYKSGELRKEHYIPSVLYYYNFISKK